ncbi:MAG: alpha/beta hydrolase-fold protein [bacterium]|nr:alpha/beta hydrolase-fold protein [bacterium]
MYRSLKYLFITFGLALLLLAGCSDRGTNVPVTADSDFIRTPQDFRIVPSVHDFYPELTFQIRNEFRLQEMATYIPEASVPPPYGTAEAVPLLVLLPPQDRNQYYYFNHGLQELADEMIAEGIIRPMIITCLSNDKVFGGYFFAGSSPFAGDYDGIIGGSLIDYLNTQFPLLDSPAKRAIGGFGQGAYGAMRAAILNPNTFTSIAVGDGPLDFDGPFGNSGLMSLFDDALTEQGLDASTYRSFDSSGVWNVSRLFIGGAMAFTPHITDVWWTRINIFAPGFPDPIGFQTQIDSVFINSDTVTLIQNKYQHKNLDIGFHLPFDGNGNAYPPVWNIWLDNNLENIMEYFRSTYGATPLSEADIMVFSSKEARLGFNEQTQSFVETLKNPPYSFDVQTKEYMGSDGNPATHDQYLYELMREMLIFHSNNFGKVK